jgi:hypothetical protein
LKYLIFILTLIIVSCKKETISEPSSSSNYYNSSYPQPCWKGASAQIHVMDSTTGLPVNNAYIYSYRLHPFSKIPDFTDALGNFTHRISWTPCGKFPSSKPSNFHYEIKGESSPLTNHYGYLHIPFLDENETKYDTIYLNKYSTLEIKVKDITNIENAFEILVHDCINPTPVTFYYQNQFDTTLYFNVIPNRSSRVTSYTSTIFDTLIYFPANDTIKLVHHY